MIKCQDKKKCNWSNYVTEGWGLVLDTFTYDDAGYIKTWTLCSSEGEEYSGTTIPDLLAVIKNLKSSYGLITKDKHTKDILVIYTDDITKLYWFLKNYDVISEEFTFYFQILENVEFRGCWYDDLESAKEIADWSKFMIDSVFGPDKYFYITPNQIPRRRMQKARKKLKDTTASDIYPTSFDFYKIMRKAFFGGILYVPYPNLIIKDPMIEIDLKSAYIYCMLIEKHCMSCATKCDPTNWEYYLESLTRASFGKYRIKYTSITNKISCYKNGDGEKLVKGEGIEDTFYFTNIDLKIFIENTMIHSVECEYLYEFDLDYLPNYVRDEVVDEYTKKELVKITNPDSDEERIQKIIVNGEYGDTSRDWTASRKSFKQDRDNANMAPQWGIWTTSYCKRLLLTLGNQLDGWFYSATDSIYCLNTEENLEKIDAFNSNIRKKIKVFCDKFGYDYDSLKDLGTFVVKTYIKKFKAFGPNTYIYTKTDGEVIIKASGCSKKFRNGLSEEEKEALYDSDYVPVGRKVRHHHTDEKTSCTINGTVYESNGSYYTLEFKGVMADYMNLIDNLINNRKR